MKYVSPEYQTTLRELAMTLCEPFKSPQPELELDYAPETKVIIKLPEEVGRVVLNRWDDMGTYLEHEDE